jgi:hypothetical protein
MPNNEAAESEHSEAPPSRRRTHSARTRAKIAHTRAEQEAKKREERAKQPLTSTFPTLSLEMRRIITERDGRECRSCGEDGPELRVQSFLRGLDDMGALERDPELHAVMCKFCREIAELMEARSMASMLRNRW